MSTEPITAGLDDADRPAVLALAERATAADGVAALSEQTLLELRAPVRDVHHLLAHADGRVVGYAQVDGPSAELVVAPEHRRHGWGRRLLDAVRDLAPGVAVWAHGNLPAAQALAHAAGMTLVRELWQMAAPVRPTAVPAPPAGVTARTFVPGEDDDAWVRLNARAFAAHPEQGRMTVADLRARQAEDWFDPTLLWLAVPDDGGAPVASMWVKVLPGEDGGEIYALGVDPDHQGRGLGSWLTAVALAEMARRGLATATLYVEGDNAPAIATYRRAGFVRTAVDVQYR